MSVTIGAFRLSPELCEKTKLVNRCLGECARKCCDEGVWLSLYDAQRIIAHADDIQPYLIQPLDFQAWKLTPHSCIETPLIAEGTLHAQCWFLTHDGLCGIHAMALDKQIPVQEVKPYFCVMFPLTLVDLDINVTEIAVDPKAYKTCLAQGESESWLYEQFEPDLRKILGNEGYEKLQRLYP